MLEDWITTEENKKRGEGASAQSIAEVVGGTLETGLNLWAWAQPDNIAWLWCSLPELIRDRPYVKAAFKKKMAAGEAAGWPGWKWDSKFTSCPVAPGAAPKPKNQEIKDKTVRSGSHSSSTTSPPPSTPPPSTYTPPAEPEGLSLGAKIGIGAGALAVVGGLFWYMQRK